MLKIKCEGNKLILFSENSASSFELFDKKYFEVIRKNIESANKEGCWVSIEKKSDKRNYLVLSWNEYQKNRRAISPRSMKLVIPDSIAYEISSRMILLNKSFKVPERSDG